MRSKVAERMLKNLTPEKREKMRLERIERNKAESLESQLGYFVGEYIVHRNLPTLSTNLMRSRKVIQVSEEDAKENERLNAEWFETVRVSGKMDDGSKEKWEKLYNHNKMLNKKYLPEKLVCYLKPLNIANVEEFKKGIIFSLWNCDMCSYDLKPENINIYDDINGDFTVIEFIRDDDE